MSQIRRFDHVGITVADLDTVTAFFIGLGLEVEGTRMFVAYARGPEGIIVPGRAVRLTRRWTSVLGAFRALLPKVGRNFCICR